MKKIYWISVNLLLIMIILTFFSERGSNSTKYTNIAINNHIFNVEIADTQTKREQGLMNRHQLEEDSGMLFVFPKADIYPFWMKNTLIPLDIVYILDNTITEIATLYPQANNDIPQYTPKNAANYVLELNAESAQKYGFKVGSPVYLEAAPPIFP